MINDRLFYFCTQITDEVFAVNIINYLKEE